MIIKKALIYVFLGVILTLFGVTYYYINNLEQKIIKLKKEQTKVIDSLYNVSEKRLNTLQYDYKEKNKRDSLLMQKYKILKIKFDEYEKKHPPVIIPDTIDKDSLRAILEEN